MEAAQAIDPAPEAKRYHHGDLRRALVEAADAILERCGPGALSLRAVAREAGVSPAAPYHHFKDKDELISAVAREGFLKLKTALAQASTETPAGDDKAAAVGLAYIRFSQQHPALYRVMYDCARKEDALPESDEGGFGTVKRAIEQAVGAGISETELYLAAIAGWCAVHGLAEMNSFAQFRRLKEELGGEEAFLRGVLHHFGMFGRFAKHG
jgi:AcrR family transcriptional regulator